MGSLTDETYVCSLFNDILISFEIYVLYKKIDKLHSKDKPIKNKLVFKVIDIDKKNLKDNYC